MQLTVKFTFFSHTLFAGLLPGLNSEWFDCIFATVKTTKSAKTNHADDEFSIAARTRRFGAAIQSSILQRHNASVSENRQKKTISFSRVSFSSLWILKKKTQSSHTVVSAHWIVKMHICVDTVNFWEFRKTEYLHQQQFVFTWWGAFFIIRRPVKLTPVTYVHHKNKR